MIRGFGYRSFGRRARRIDRLTRPRSPGGGAPDKSETSLSIVRFVQLRTYQGLQQLEFVANCHGPSDSDLALPSLRLCSLGVYV